MKLHHQGSDFSRQDQHLGPGFLKYCALKKLRWSYLATGVINTVTHTPKRAFQENHLIPPVKHGGGHFMIQGHHHCTCSEDVISSKLVKQEFNDGPDHTIKPHR